MTRRRLFDDPRDIDLHFDEPLRARRKVADEPPVRRPINSFPPIEFTTQRTRQAVYCLVRGIGESIEQSSASAVAGWLSGAKGIAVSRHGPSVYPGPDGSQYEWFFRLEGVDGDKLRSLDEVYESSRRRLANRPVPTEVAVAEPRLSIEDDVDALDLPLADISRTEIARIAGHLAREVQRLHRLLATRLRLIWQLRKSAAMASSVQIDASADHTVLDQMWAELTLRDKHYSAKEESLVECYPASRAASRLGNDGPRKLEYANFA
jgi:hypothetical protein